jgi:hypothetical protein
VKRFFGKRIAKAVHRIPGEFPGIEFSPYTCNAEDLEGIGRKHKPGSITPIEERSETELIAAAKEGSPPLIPNSECKLAQQKLRAFLSPLFVRSQDQLTVGQNIVGGVPKTKRGTNITAVMQGSVGYHS